MLAMMAGKVVRMRSSGVYVRLCSFNYTARDRSVAVRIGAKGFLFPKPGVELAWGQTQFGRIVMACDVYARFANAARVLSPGTKSCEGATLALRPAAA